ncbi:MAG: bacterial Ig-like domain-containing protein, partial [Eubacteriales bacterium]|nr:bacterial Ig-like domain-containing protein [Eubacteriales bacterium]
SSLKYEWHIVSEDTDYTLPGDTGSWTMYVDEGFGMSKDGKTLYFQGVETGLDGTLVYCIVSNSLGTAQTNHATVIVTDEMDVPPPPEINVPAVVTVRQGEEAVLTCSVNTGNAGQYYGPWLQYEWQRLKTNVLAGGSDVIEKTDGIVSDLSFSCTADTSKPGTFFYVCKVTDGDSGLPQNVSYSGIVTVEVTEREEIVSLEITSLPYRKVYELGDSPDINGLKVRVYTSDGFYDTDDLSLFTVSPAVFSAGGVQQVTISLDGVSAGYDVTVSEPDEPQPAFSITKQPASVTADEGKMAEFSCSCNMEAEYVWGMITPEGETLYWINEAKYPVQGTQTDTIKVEAIAEMDGTVFFCGITPEGMGVQYTEQAVLKVNRKEVTPPGPDNGEKGSIIPYVFIGVLGILVIVLSALVVKKKRKEEPVPETEEETGEKEE